MWYNQIMKNKKILLGVLLLIIIVISAYSIIPKSIPKNKEAVDYFPCIPQEGIICPSNDYSGVELPKDDNNTIINTNKITLDQNNKKSSCESNGGEWFEASKICEINSFDQNMCVEKGGEWNECNSACRHNPGAEMCTMQCVLTCSFR